MFKRTLDFSVSLLAIVVFFPLFIFIALWIKLDSQGPIFYRGKRGGRHGRLFLIFKFRSMVQNADRIGGPSTSGDDKRVTRSGRVIRGCKLDELSQLINVLRGDMSLVGPRPEVYWKVEKFGEQEQKTLELRPGITDWASIWNSNEGGVLEGASDADAMYERVIKPTKLKLQLYYVQTRNMWIDLKIIFFTIVRIAWKNWTPQELRGYPSFDELRSEVQSILAEESRLTRDPAQGGVSSD